MVMHQDHASAQYRAMPTDLIRQPENVGCSINRRLQKNKFSRFRRYMDTSTGSALALHAKKYLFYLAATLLLCSCDENKIWLESNKPDNGVRKLRISGVNYHYLPLKEAQFLIEDKVWLTGFSRKATDNSIGSISLHAFPPGFEPWSKERHSHMYGDGLSLNVVKITIEDIYDGKDILASEVEGIRNRFQRLPYGRIDKSRVTELPANNSIGLIHFRTETDELSVTKRSRYVYIENKKVKYDLACDSYCNLEFIREKYRVQMSFNSNYLNDSVAMADKLQVLLDKFEQDGQRYAHLAKMTERGKVGVF